MLMTDTNDDLENTFNNTRGHFNMTEVQNKKRDRN